MFCINCGNEIKENSKFCTNCGKDSSLSKKKNKIFLLNRRNKLIAIVSIAMVLILSVVYYVNKSRSQDAEQIQNDIASAVVNIYCEGVNGWDDESQISGGSGTIITTDGLILTNSHIIPEGDRVSLDEKSCIVILPDPQTGSSKEIYYARAVVIPDISEKYDLAFVQIDDVYYDKEEGKAYGEYPKVFPAYDSGKYCKNENVKLGESIRIYGYPAISGGYALTITEGIVSSLLPQEGLIITSAKISHGNSGGLAVDQYGCRIGIPYMVSGDNYESLGVIISNDLIANFTDELRVFLKNNP